MEIPGFCSLQLHTLVVSFLFLASTLGNASPVSGTEDSSTKLEQTEKSCQNVNSASKCHNSIPYAQLPNVYGHSSQEQATQELEETLRKFAHPGKELVSFLCTLYFPPCSLGSYHLGESTAANALTPLPCRSMCETALTSTLNSNQGQDSSEWPVQCHSLPTERCYHLGDQGKLTYIHKSLSPVTKINSVGNGINNNNYGSPSSASKSDEVVQFASIEAELGDEENYDVEVVSLSSSQNPIRRYDITDLGDPELFHGWADVQGIGAANDYCRVIGKAKRRFLSCNLAGTWGQGHHYVSKLGFEVGYPGTWFMRDMDGDGKDDYCRCVGPTSDSKVTCMKAGQRGFYGSTTQSGSQHTFSLPFSNNCHDKKVNAMFGE